MIQRQNKLVAAAVSVMTAAMPATGMSATRMSATGTGAVRRVMAAASPQGILVYVDGIMVWVMTAQSERVMSVERNGVVYMHPQ